MKRFCTYCGEQCSSTTIDEHQRECRRNPRNKAKKVEEAKIEKSEQLCLSVADNVKTLDDIIPLMTKVMFDNGYDIAFNSIPDRWSDKAYNNPHNVRFPNDLKVYAGWRGTWRGTIKPHRGYKKVTISDLNSSWSSDKFRFTFIRTESGSSGEDFDISGHILVDDFPHLHNEFFRQGYNERHQTDINAKVQSIRDQIKIEQNDFVNADENLIEIRRNIAEIKKVYDKANNLAIERQAELNSYFKENKKVELPEIECPYIDMSQYIRLKLDYENKTEVIDSGDMTERVKALSVSIKNALKIAEHNLEYFV